MSPPRILIVEDSPDDEALILRALAKSGIQCQTESAHRGEEAVEILQRPGPLPDMVLLDMKMPGMDGLDVLKWARANPRTQDLTIVMFSSSTRIEDVGDCIAAGANGYERKPVSHDEFTAVVRRLAEEWLPKQAVQDFAVPTEGMGRIGQKATALFR